MNPTLGRITIYPIKSLDGVDLDSATILPSGALLNDRRFALVDAAGRFINGKRTAAVHLIRATYDLAAMTVRFNNEHEFALLEEQRQIGEYLASHLNVGCQLIENANTGFPDDTAAAGPTLISTATLCEIANWFPNLTLEESRRRFRANLAIDGVEPFWEDQLVGPQSTSMPFSIGGVHLLGSNPCQRCVVPTRDSISGEPAAGFQKSFARRREASLPAWAPRDRFNHFYRLAINTHLPSSSSGGAISLGDLLTLSGTTPVQAL